jgi:hypothetical protein
MMAINFPAAAFLASLKAPSQIMYCISQDTGAPVVVYKDAHNIQQSISVPPWAGTNQEVAYNNQKNIQQINNAPVVTQHQSTIRVEAGNQVSLKLREFGRQTRFYKCFRSRQFRSPKFHHLSQLSRIRRRQTPTTLQHPRSFKPQPATFKFLVKYTPFLIHIKTRRSNKTSSRTFCSNPTTTKVSLKPTKLRQTDQKTTRIFIVRCARNRFD